MEVERCRAQRAVGYGSWPHLVFNNEFHNFGKIEADPHCVQSVMNNGTIQMSGGSDVADTENHGRALRSAC